MRLLHTHKKKVIIIHKLILKNKNDHYAHTYKIVSKKFDYRYKKNRINQFCETLT